MGRGLSAESRSLIDRAYEVLRVEHPSGVRRVTYALFGNQADTFVKRVGKQLGNARKRGLIPWEWISDDTRPCIEPFVVEDMNDLRTMNAVCPSYNPWPSQGVRVVIWSEKSLGGTLMPLLKDYLVRFQVHHGNTSLTELRKYAEWTRHNPHMRLVILYVGDHDCKGLRISEDDIPKRLRERRAINWDVKRVAILRADAEAVNVEDRDAFKPKDADVKWYRAHTGLSYGVEVETLPSTELRNRVEQALLAEIVDAAAWNRSIDASRLVRESWEAYVDQWPAPSIEGLGSE
jgi:hypothetical protein